MITQTINLNLIPGCPLPRINVSQYDNGSRTLQFNLYNGVSPYEIPSGASVSIVGTKADNTGFEYACTFSGSLVSVDITDQMTVFAGEVQSELRIAQNGEILGTANFIINVERAALSDDTQISETDIPIIQRIPEILAEAEEYADTAHKWATFGADTETPSSTNNAKYWAEQSQVYAAGALHWKSSVTFANIPTSGMIVGDFYNITDDFTTDSRFDEGAGIKCAAGTNIVWDTNNKWDILTPSTVASQVKYDGTTSGLSATNVQSAIDEVVSDVGAVETRVGNLETEMGSSDISAIGDGTVTGSITEINSDLSDLSSRIIVKNYPIVASIYGIAASDGNVALRNNQSGIVMLDCYGATKLHFYSYDIVSLQIGGCDSSATLPTIISTGAGRGNYINYTTTIGDNVVTLPSRGISGNIFIGLISSNATTISDIYFTT